MREQIGPYRILEELGRGGMGRVYRGQDAGGRDVAVKLITGQRSQDAEAHERFRVEAQTQIRLDHPNIVPILAAGRDDDGMPWIALEYVNGESLEERIQREGQLPIDDTVRILIELTQAIQHAHTNEVLHRDLKPHNVLLRGDEVLLTDFGLALDAAAAAANRVTIQGHLVGSPGYWAPEQAQGETNMHCERTDVYGLGAVLYACLTGRPPVQAKTLGEFLKTHQYTRYKSPRRVRTEVPDWLSGLCMRCLSIVPATRPEVPQLLEALRTETNPRIPGHPAPEPTPRPLAAVEPLPEIPQPQADRSSMTAVVLSSFSILIATVVIVGTWSITPNTETPPQTASEPEEPAQRTPYAYEGRELPTNLESDRERAERLSLAGSAKARHGQLLEALSLYDRALALDPEDPVTHRYRGEANLKLGNRNAAMRDLNQALLLDPDDGVTRVIRSRLLTKQGRLNEAVAELTQGLRLLTAAVGGSYLQSARVQNALLERAALYEQLDRTSAAIADYEAALKGGLGRKLEQEIEAKLADLGADTR